MGSGNSHQRAIAKAANKHLDEVPSTPSPNKSTSQRLLDFLEQPLFLSVAGSLSGLIGMFYFWPVLVVFGFCIVLALHRSGAVKGTIKWKQMLIYAALSVATTLCLYAVGRVLDKGGREFIQHIADAVKDAMRPPTSQSSPPQDQNHKSQDQRSDVWQNLTAVAYLPPSQDVWESMFTVQNTSKSDIGRHQISCIVNRITTERFVDAEMSKGKLRHIWPNIPIRRGSDGQSDNCLQLLNFGPVICADVTVEIEYEIIDQPNLIQRKEFRFVTHKGEGMWLKQPVDFKGLYCAKSN